MFYLAFLVPTPIVLLRFTSRPWGVASLLRGWKREKAALRVERGVYMYMSYSAVCISRLQFDLCTIEPSTIGPSRTYVAILLDKSRTIFVYYGRRPPRAVGAHRLEKVSLSSVAASSGPWAWGFFDDLHTGGSCRRVDRQACRGPRESPLPYGCWFWRRHHPQPSVMGGKAPPSCE